MNTNAATAKTILTNPTPVQLEAVVEENLFDLFRAMVRVLPGSELVESDKLSYHLAFPTNPMFKGVWCTRLSPNEVEETVDQTIAYCDYVYRRYGRFPANSGPFRTILAYQAHQLDLGFYDKFYRPDVLSETQRYQI